MSRKVRLRKGSKIENEQEGEIENLTNCDCQQESSCGFVARGENTHRVDDRDDPVLNIAIVIIGIDDHCGQTDGDGQGSVLSPNPPLRLSCLSSSVANQSLFKC